MQYSGHSQRMQMKQQEQPRDATKNADAFADLIECLLDDESFALVIREAVKDRRKTLSNVYITRTSSVEEETTSYYTIHRNNLVKNGWK